MGTEKRGLAEQGRSKTALIETVRYGFQDELLQRVASQWSAALLPPYWKRVRKHDGCGRPPGQTV